MENTLTIEEALKQGYTSFVYASDGYQTIKNIEEYKEEIDWKRDDIYLVEKEPFHPSGLSSKQIGEMIAEQISTDHSWDTGDDTDSVYDAIIDLDFTDAENKIREALCKLDYYKQTKIRLIKDIIC